MNKSKILIIAILCSYTLLGQRTFNQSVLEYSPINYQYASLEIDPGGSINEGGINWVARVGIVYKWLHIGASYQRFDALTFGYQDYAAHVSYVYTKDKFQLFAGMRYGRIIRGNNTSFQLYGFEGIINYELSRHWRITGRTTNDRRPDFTVTAGEPGFRWNFYTGITYVL